MEEALNPSSIPSEPSVDIETDVETENSEEQVDVPEEQEVLSENESAETEDLLEEDSSEEDEEDVVVPKKSLLRIIIENRKRILSILGYVVPSLLFLFSVFVIAYYIIIPAKTEFHSDCTDTIFWAKATYDSGKMINPDFSYACLLPFGGNLLMLVFMPFFGLSMTTQTLGMLLFFAIFTASFCWMLHEMGWGMKGICYSTSALLLFLCSSKKIREIFWGHVIYYSLGILFIFIGLALLFRLQNLRERRLQTSKNKNLRIHEIITLVILFVFFMLCCTDQVTAITIFALPMMAAIFAERLLDRETKLVSSKNIGNLFILILLGIALVLGMKLGNFWAGDTTAGYASAYSDFTEQSEWVENAQKFLLAWMTLLGLEDIPGEALMSGTSIVNLIRMMTSLLLLVLPIIASCCYPKYKGKSGRQMRILIWAHWVITALIMVGYICGKLSAANWRLSPIIAMSIVVSLAFLHWAIAEKTSMQRFALLMCVPVIALSGLNVWSVKDIDSNYKDTDLYQLVDLLEERDLTYGYATFWRSQAMTVISGDKVRVCCATVDESGARARDYQIDDTWFDEDSEDCFLLLDSGEYQTLVLNNAEVLTYDHQEEILTTTSGSTFQLLIFSENVF